MLPHTNAIDMRRRAVSDSALQTSRCGKRCHSRRSSVVKAKDRVGYGLKVLWCSPFVRCLVVGVVVVVCIPGLRSIREDDFGTTMSIDQQRPRANFAKCDLQKCPQGCLDDSNTCCDSSCDGGCFTAGRQLIKCHACFPPFESLTTATLKSRGTAGFKMWGRLHLDTIAQDMGHVCRMPLVHTGREVRDVYEVKSRLNKRELFSICLNDCKEDNDCIGISWRSNEVSETLPAKEADKKIAAMHEGSAKDFLRDDSEGKTKGLVLMEVRGDSASETKDLVFVDAHEHSRTYMCGRIKRTWLDSPSPAVRTGNQQTGFHLIPQDTGTSCIDNACQSCVKGHPANCLACEHPFSREEEFETGFGKCVLRLPTSAQHYGASHDYFCKEQLYPRIEHSNPRREELGHYWNAIANLRTTVGKSVDRCLNTCRKMGESCVGFGWSQSSRLWRCTFCKEATGNPSRARGSEDHARGWISMRGLFGSTDGALKGQPLRTLEDLGKDSDGAYHLDVTKTTLELPGLTLTTRGYNGQVPGPTLRVKPGDAVHVKVSNSHTGFTESEMPGHSRKLAYTGCHEPDPSVTNLHVHGWHVGPDQDDVLDNVDVGESKTYTYTLPKDHHAGSSWYHPHVHGNAAGQVMGGVAGALIVEDDWDNVMAITKKSRIGKWLKQISAPGEDITAVIQHWNFRSGCDGSATNLPVSSDSFSNRCLGALLHNARSTGDQAVHAEFHTQDMIDREFLTVNGQYQPVLSLVKHRWYRLRLIYAASASSVLLKRPDGCTWLLLAKDGIYVDDLPRELDDSGVFLAPGGRADMAVKCSSGSAMVTKDMDASIWPGLTLDGGVWMMGLKTVEKQDDHLFPEPRTEPPKSAKGMFSWKPDYLRDLRQEKAQDWSLGYVPAAWNGGDHAVCREAGMKICRGTEICLPPSSLLEKGTHFMDVNHDDDPPLAKGEVYNFKMMLADVHHMHTYPVQLQYAAKSGPDLTPAEMLLPSFFKSGDWHDTLQLGSDWFLRFRTASYAGPIIVHCITPKHEVGGTVGYFRVSGSS